MSQKIRWTLERWDQRVKALTLKARRPKFNSQKLHKKKKAGYLTSLRFQIHTMIRVPPWTVGIE